MPLQGILNTARTLSFYGRRQEVTANNLANATTDGFKADRVLAHTLIGSITAVPVQSTDLRQGTFRETGRSLDLGLQGDGYFVVSTAQGERLTRGGSFRIDSAGRLANAQGDLVLGDAGPIVLEGGKVEVRGDGSVMVDGQGAGRLRVVTPDDPQKLVKEGFGRYAPGGEVHAVDEDTTQVRQGAVEEANLDPLLSMVDLVTIQRAYAANVDALKAMDSVLGAVTNDVGKVI